MNENSDLTIKESQERLKNWMQSVGAKPVKRSEQRQGEAIVYILIDCSTSMNEIIESFSHTSKVVGYSKDEYGRRIPLVDSDKTKLFYAKQGAISFAEDAIKKNYSVGIIKFADRSSMICEPTKSLALVQSSLDNLRADGATEMAEGIKLATKKLCDLQAYRAMVIVTDGQPFGGDSDVERARRATLKEAVYARERCIDIITIGTDDADLEFLKELATRSDLASYVRAEKLGSAIREASKLLPGPQK